MSIYPVPVAEWFPSSKDKDEKFLRSVVLSILKDSKCAVCEKKPDIRYAWVWHSLPWGHNTEEVWCTKRCYLERNK